MAQLQPLLDNVLIKPIESDSTTASGIVIPDTVSKEKPIKGEVLAVGPGADGKEMPVKVGDVVYFSQYGPREIKFDGEELYIIAVDSLLAVEA